VFFVPFCLPVSSLKLEILYREEVNAHMTFSPVSFESVLSCSMDPSVTLIYRLSSLDRTVF